MPFNLRNRSLLSLVHHTAEEIDYLVGLAADLKRAKRMGNEVQRLKGRNIALIFEKTSTRTRSAFEVAAYDQGAHTTFFDPSASQFGHKESVKDSARVLGQIYDGIEYRGFSQKTVEELKAYAGVPVWNGLTDEWHPTQMLCDLLTMQEACGKRWSEISFAYMGDARFNTGNSLLMVGAKMGMDVRIGAPRQYWPSREIIDMCRAMAEVSGARITLTEDPAEAVRGCDFIHTDIWVSMGEPAEVWDERIAALKPYQVNAALMAASGNPHVKFMHCLPAYHNGETKVGRAVIARHPELAGGIEVTEEVFESPASIVFQQAGNRLHTIKAVMVASLAA
ncbi:MAG: ornithine carbamoyltransferase [Duodenibacillus sp.]|nr:ornithine carbamoyltransferase [Duodenibacillus sp.]